jgi:hypothetical protein
MYPDAEAVTPVTLIGCSGVKTSPLIFNPQMKGFDFCSSVPTFIIYGQSNDLKLGSNVIRHLIHVKKISGDFWKKISYSVQDDTEGKAILSAAGTSIAEPSKNAQCHFIGREDCDTNIAGRLGPSEGH